MAQIIYWALDLSREREWSEEERMIMNSSGSEFNEQDTNRKVVRKRNISLNTISTAQICIPIIRVTFHEALVIGTCIMNIREGEEPKNI